MAEIKANIFIVRIKDGSKEIEVQVPLTLRTQIGFGTEGTGAAAVKLVGELIGKLKGM